MKFKPAPKESQAAAEQVGKRIFAVRTERRITQERLGELLSPPLKKQAIGQIEKGNVHISYIRLVDIARVLHVSYHYLLTGEGEPDVVMSPLKVVSGRSYPVQVIEQGLKPAENRYVYVDFEPDPSDRAVEVKDRAMFPEFHPGDETIFRNIQPLPGDYVWAIDGSGNLLLRAYRQTRDGFELIAKDDMFAPVDGGKVEVLGVVIDLKRKFKRD
jgi:transcriptional regulator with XRE-family HTH domain